jgi:hypothetical protein
MHIQYLFKRPFHSIITQILAVIFAVMAWSQAFCGEVPDPARPGASQKVDEVFYLNGVQYNKPETFKVSKSFSEMGGMTTYSAAQDSQILKLILTPAVPQNGIPFEITKIKFYGEDGNLSTGSFSAESIAGSKGPQTDIVIIGRSILQKDGETMLYLSFTIYAPIDKMSKKVSVKYDDTNLFSLDMEKSTVK